MTKVKKKVNREGGHKAANSNFKQNPMYRYLLILTAIAAVGFQSWRTIFNNFAAEVVGLDGDLIGFIQSAREVPGFLTFLVIFVIIFIKEEKLSALSIVTLGLGIFLTGFFPSFWGLMMTTLIMSLGFHYYETTNKSLSIQYFSRESSPLVLAKQRSISALMNILVGVVIFGAAYYFSYQEILATAGLIVGGFGLWALGQNPGNKDLPLQKKKLIFRKKYLLFYFLNFMAGARRQIFIAFAVFLLVKKFEFTVPEISLLFLVNNLINYFLSPLIGQAIVKFGERRVLSLEYFSLILIFASYALVDSKVLVALLYILDHIFFNFAIAIQTYFQKVGDPRDFAPSMAVSFTINHIAAVFLPAVGGLLWIIDYRIPFLMGAFISFISLLAVQNIRYAKDERSL